MVENNIKKGDVVVRKGTTTKYIVLEVLESSFMDRVKESFVPSASPDLLCRRIEDKKIGKLFSAEVEVEKR